MKTEDIRKMALAWQQVQEASKKKMDPVDKDELKGDYKDREDKDIDNDGDEDESDEYLHNRRKAVSKAMKKDDAVTMNPKAEQKEAKIDEVLDTPKAMARYRDKATASRSAAASSATAKDFRSKDKEFRDHPAKDLKTMAKRTAGLRMVGNKAANKLRKDLTKEEVELDESVSFNGRTFKDYKTFNSEKKANDFLEKNEDYGVIGEKGGKVYVAKIKDMGKRMNKEEVELDELSSEKLRQYQIGNEKDRERLSGKIGLIKKGQQTPQQKKDIAKLKSRVKNDYLSLYKSSPYVFGKDKAKVHASDVKKPSWYKEEVELEEGAKEKALKALMTRALGGKRAKAGYTSAVANNGDFVVKDGGGRIVGRIKSGEYTDPLKENTWPVYNRILENRAMRYKGAAPADPMDKGQSPGGKQMKKDVDIDTSGKISNYDDLGHDDATKAGLATKKSPGRSNDRSEGDKNVVNPVKDTTK